MTGASRRGFAERPGATAPNADAWVRRDEGPASAEPRRSEVYAARLTIDVTKALRGRIKMAAFAQGVTVADMLRDLLEAHFPDMAAMPRPGGEQVGLGDRAVDHGRHDTKRDR